MKENTAWNTGGGQAENGSQAQPTAEGQTAGFLQSIDVQIAALAVIIVAVILSIIVLKNIKERQTGLYPCKDYSLIDSLPKASTALTTLVALYFLYLAWVDHTKRPENSALTWLLVANALALAAAAIKLNVLYTAPESRAETEEVIESAVE